MNCECKTTAHEPGCVHLTMYPPPRRQPPECLSPLEVALNERDAALLQVEGYRKALEQIADNEATPMTAAKLLARQALHGPLDLTQKPVEERRKWSVCSCTEGMGVAVLCPVHGVGEKRVVEGA